MGRGRFCGVGFVGKRKGRLSRKELWVAELLLKGSFFYAFAMLVYLFSLFLQKSMIVE